MEEMLFIALFFIWFILLSILFNYLFDKYSIKKQYYSIVAKNKYFYYLVKFILSVVLVVLGITSFIVNELYLYIIFIIYCCLYLSLYGRHPIDDWKKVKEIYIDNKHLEIKKNMKKRKIWHNKNWQIKLVLRIGQYANGKI